jgi:hypothetical protein
MEPVKVDQAIRGEKGKDLLVTAGFKFRFQNILAESMERRCCTIQHVNATQGAMKFEAFSGGMCGTTTIKTAKSTQTDRY